MNRYIANGCIALSFGIYMLTSAQPAQAGNVQFEYSAGELSSSASVAALYDRIRRSSRRACESLSGLLPLPARNDCRSGLAADIVLQIDHPALTAVYSASEPRMTPAERRSITAWLDGE